MIAISPLGIKKSNRQAMVNKTLHRNQRLNNMNTKPRGGVPYCAQTDSQGSGSLYRQTQSNMNTKPRGGVLRTDRHRAT